ncbi:hypothetical protein ACFVUW_10240 [Streptomyces xiamenensis]|uniref:hypothetical protein n=1 Tax=Streptomyces xiamenensis TaxID=408015 RepID=UPI0036E43540
MAIRACLGSAAGVDDEINRIREEGHAMGSSPVHGWSMIAAPLWYGSAVAGSVALLVGDAQMKRSVTRARCVAAVMDAAAAISRRLSRSSARRVN